VGLVHETQGGANCVQLAGGFQLAGGQFPVGHQVALENLRERFRFVQVVVCCVLRLMSIGGKGCLRLVLVFGDARWVRWATLCGPFARFPETAREKELETSCSCLELPRRLVERPTLKGSLLIEGSLRGDCF